MQHEAFQFQVSQCFQQLFLVCLMTRLHAACEFIRDASHSVLRLPFLQKQQVFMK